MGPATYQEWIRALISLGSVVEVDCLKIDKPDAEAFVGMIPADEASIRIIFYNCGDIPWNLLTVANRGRGRIKFKM